MIDMASISIVTQEERRKEYLVLGWWMPSPYTTVPAHWLFNSENRLDGRYYTAEVNSAFRLINDCGLPIELLENLVDDIFVLDRFRRIYARDETSGWPYLSASESLEFRPSSTRYIAKDHAPRKAKLHFSQSGWLLVSASGTVGRMSIATERLSKYFLTHDLIRIVPKESTYIGYLYAYLISNIGQVLIEKDQYGSAINHLEPHHLAKVPVPIMPEEVQSEIHANIMRVYALRDESNDLLTRAENLLHTKLGLPKFNENLVPYLALPITPSIPSSISDIQYPKAFSIKVSEIEERFDASFHVPIAKTAVSLLRNCNFEPVQLGEMCIGVQLPPRFKRIYVTKDHGVPFLQSSHIPQTRYHDLKYISKKANAKHIHECLVYQGYVLITRSGTVGRIGLVTSTTDKWAASEHMLRIVPDLNRGHPGYIAAFLLTPYGQHQLKSKIYGGVVDELTPEDTSSLWIPNAPMDVQSAIGDLVIEAFEKKDEASNIENETIQSIEKILVGRIQIGES